MTGDSGMTGRASTFAVAFTHRGRRARNEDAVRRVDLPDGGFLAIVCDGMGGHAGGAYASATALDGVVRRVSDGVDPLEAIREANAELYAYAALDAARTGMGTTLVMVIVRQGVASVYNVGDSRAYLCEPGGTCRPVTRDHSFVAESVASGELNEAQALASRYKNALTRAVGTDADVEADRFGPFDLSDGSVLVLCSDGFYKAIPDARIGSLFRGEARTTVEDVAEAVLAAFDAGSDDNISVVVVGEGAVRARSVAARLVKLSKRLDRQLAREARAARRREGGGGARLVLRTLIALGLVLAGIGALVAGLSSDGATPTTPRVSSEQAPPRDEESGPERRSIEEIVGSAPAAESASRAARRDEARRDEARRDEADRADSTSRGGRPAGKAPVPAEGEKQAKVRCEDPANKSRPECAP